jgi:hypothetical protein
MKESNSRLRLVNLEQFNTNLVKWLLKHTPWNRLLTELVMKLKEIKLNLKNPEKLPKKPILKVLKNMLLNVPSLKSFALNL